MTRRNRCCLPGRQGRNCSVDAALWIVQAVKFKGEEMPEPVSVENHTW
jgi:hypothetical protein